MSSKLKLWINLFAIVLVFAIIVISVGALLSKGSHFLDIPGTKSETENLSMEIRGKVNGKDFFIISFVDGAKTQSIDTINTEEMRFSSERTQIDLDMVFENHSDNTLYIEISGIYKDTAKFPSNPRFDTLTYVNGVHRLPLEDESGHGKIILQLEPRHIDSEPSMEEGSLINFKISYILRTFNRNINNEKQDLFITISKDMFDL